MNSDEIESASAKFAERLQKESGGDLKAAVDLAYRLAFARPPSRGEKDRALTYLAERPGAAEGLRLAAVQPGRVHLRAVNRP